MRYRDMLETGVIVGVLGCLVVGPALAQVRGAPARRASSSSEAPILRIRDIEGLGRDAKVKTPLYSSNAPKDVGSEVREWGQIKVVYDTFPEWIDELTFQYSVMSLQVEEGNKKVFTLYRGTVRYMDVAEGNKHASTMFLLPSALKRFGDIVAVAVEIKAEGKIVGVIGDMDRRLASILPEEWWSNPAVVDSKEVRKRDSYMVDRSKSPFALVNIDSHEMIRP